MFEEEEEQQQDVAPLKAALEEAAAAAEAQGRSKQPGQAAASHGPTTLSHSLCFNPLLHPQPCLSVGVGCILDYTCMYTAMTGVSLLV